MLDAEFDVSFRLKDYFHYRHSLSERFVSKAIGGRIALQSTACEMQRRYLILFRASLECARVLASLSRRNRWVR